MLTIRIRANKLQYNWNSRYTSKTEPESKQYNFKTIIINKFKWQNINEMLNECNII